MTQKLAKFLTILLNLFTAITSTQEQETGSENAGGRPYHESSPYELEALKKKTYFLNTRLDRTEIIGISSFATYTFNYTDQETKKDFYDAKNTFILIRSAAVYIRTFERPWFFMTFDGYGPILEMNLALRFINRTRFTAMHMDVNTRQLLLASNDLRLRVFDLKEKPAGGDGEMGWEMDLVQNLDTGHSQGLLEEGYMVRSIAKLPDEKVFLMSSNRFEILKVDGSGGNFSVSVYPNPIDDIRFFKTPSKAYEFKQEVYPYFVATSLNDNMNVIMDYTKMKALRFFSLSLIPSKLKN